MEYINLTIPSDLGSQYSRDSREHALVDGEELVGDLCASHGWSSQDIPETDVIKITDILAGGM